MDPLHTCGELLLQRPNGPSGTASCIRLLFDPRLPLLFVAINPFSTNVSRATRLWWEPANSGICTSASRRSWRRGRHEPRPLGPSGSRRRPNWTKIQVSCPAGPVGLRTRRFGQPGTTECLPSHDVTAGDGQRSAAPRHAHGHSRWRQKVLVFGLTSGLFW